MDFAGGGQLVVLARRALLGVGDGLPLPLRADQVIALQAAHGRIDGAAGQAGHLHDAEAVDEAGIERLQNHGRGVGEFGVGGFGIAGHGALYLCSNLLDKWYMPIAT